MAFAGATMFVSAAVLTIIALVLPHRPGPDPVADLITSAVALACGGVLIAARNHLRVWFFHVLVQLGNVLIAAGMYAGGPTESTEHYALLYLWGALYASYFFSRRAAVIHTLCGALTYGLVLLVKEPNLFWISRWFVMMGSFLIAAVVVNWLTQQIRTLARNDSLTDLFNRRTFEEELDRAYGEPSAIAALCASFWLISTTSRESTTRLGTAQVTGFSRKLRQLGVNRFVTMTYWPGTEGTSSLFCCPTALCTMRRSSREGCEGSCHLKRPAALGSPCGMGRRVRTRS
jgi:hypothetical protein